MVGKIGDFAELTSPADGDLFEVVDVSDTTDDASGSTRRIAWSTFKAAFVEVSGDTMTGNLEVEGAAPKFTLDETDQAADARAWKIQASAGTLKISSASDAGAQQTAFININRATGELDMTGASSVSVPDLTATGPLTVEYNNARLWIKDTNAGADLNSFYLTSIGGTLRLYSATDAGADARQLLYFDHDGAECIVLTDSVSVPGLSASGNVTVNNAQPKLYLFENDQAADAGNWSVQGSGGDFFLSAANDAGSIQTQFLRVRRSTGVLDLDVGASSVSVPDLTANGNMRLSSAQPILSLYETDGTADERLYEIYANSGAFVIRQSTDAGASVSELVRYIRSTGELRLTGNTKVTVPDLTASGEVTIDAPTGTSQLTLKNAAAGDNLSQIMFQTSGGSDQHAIVHTDGAELRLERAGVEYFKVDQTGDIDMSDAPSVSVPAAADGDTNTAAQTTDFDSATGQVQVNGVEAGDTGWRDVSGDLINGWVAANCRVRRSGEVVEMHFSGLDPTSATSPDFWVSSTGFTPRFSTFGACQVSNSSGIPVAATSGLMVASNGDWRAVNSGTTKYNGTISFLASDTTPWPSSLPGTAA